MARSTSSGTGSEGGQGTKTLAIRLTEAQHAQLADRTLTEEIRLAVEHWIDQSRQSPEFTAKAQELLDEIDREARARRDAITALLPQSESSSTQSGSSKRGGSPSKQRGSGKTGGDTSS
jgi:hypothetical protein